MVRHPLLQPVIGAVAVIDGARLFPLAAQDDGFVELADLFRKRQCRDVAEML
jgi:hypothetical protein